MCGRLNVHASRNSIAGRMSDASGRYIHLVGCMPGLYGDDGMVDQILILAWHLFVLGVGIAIGIAIERNGEDI